MKRGLIFSLFILHLPIMFIGAVAYTLYTSLIIGWVLMREWLDET